MIRNAKTNVGYKLGKVFTDYSQGNPGLDKAIKVKGYIEKIFFPGDILPNGLPLPGNTAYIDWTPNLYTKLDQDGNKVIEETSIWQVEWNNILRANRQEDNPVVFRLRETPQELLASIGNREVIQKIKPIIEYVFHPTDFLSGEASIISDSKFNNTSNSDNWQSSYRKNKTDSYIQLFSSARGNGRIPGS
jgi:hypothetical protein